MMYELIKVLGPMGFILWLVHRNTTHTIPKLAKDFKDSQDTARQDFKEVLHDQREIFLQESQREREAHGQYIKQIAAAITSLKDSIISSKKN